MRQSRCEKTNLGTYLKGGNTHTYLVDMDDCNDLFPNVIGG